MSDCACPRRDAEECYRYRHPLTTDEDLWDDDAYCECSCHDDDTDPLDWPSYY